MDDTITLEKKLSDRENLAVVKRGYNILHIIKDETSQNRHANATGIAKILYEKELAQYIKDKKLYKTKHKTKVDGIGKKCRQLENLGLIEEQEVINKKDEKAKYYSLTDEGKELLDNYSLAKIESIIKQKPPKKNISKNINVYHITQIRQLLLRIINEFPDVYDYYVSVDEFDTFQKIYSGERLSFEDDVLYNDLTNHLGTFISFQELQGLIGEFKEKATQLPVSRNDVRNEIKTDIQDTLDLVHDLECKNPNSFSDDLIEWIFNGILYHIEVNGSDPYNQKYIDHEFQVDRCPDGFLVKVDAFRLMNLSKEYTKNKINELRNMMEDIEEASSYNSVMSFISHRNDIKEIRRTIIDKLSKETQLSNYPGNCPFN